MYLILHSVSNTATWDHSAATYDFRNDTFPHTGTTWMVPPRRLATREWDCVGRADSKLHVGVWKGYVMRLNVWAAGSLWSFHSFLVWKVTDLAFSSTHREREDEREGGGENGNLHRHTSCSIPISCWLTVDHIGKETPVSTLNTPYQRDLVYKILWKTEARYNFKVQKLMCTTWEHK